MADLDFLSSIPIFSFFTRPELEEAVKKFSEITRAKDDVLTRIGEDGNTFYVVLEGELQVWNGEDPPRQMGTLKRGDFFGEMALLQGGKRTAGVTVSRRAQLLEVGKDAFNEVFLRNSKAIEYFARVLSKRLAGVTLGQSQHRSTTTISVGSLSDLKGETLVSFALASVLHKITDAPCLVVQVRTDGADSTHTYHLADDLDRAAGKITPPRMGTHSPAVLEITVPSGRTTAEYGERVANLVSKLSDSFTFIVFDLGSGTPGLIESASDYSDYYIGIVNSPTETVVTGKPRSMKVVRLINRVNPMSRPVPINSSEPYVLPVDPVLAGPVREAAELITRYPRSAPARPIFRLARKLLGSSVGLALGGGAAFGIAHLGVLKVLEENDVPIDLVAGCSQGSIISVGYASGLGVAEMIEIARTLGVKGNFIKASDPTFLLQPGILAGQRFVSMMRPYLQGKETFDQLVLPCRTVATDIETGERISIGTGRLETAYRASSSVPMVMAPIKVGERSLVDGGVADPVPAEITSEMGADLTIAVNVVPRLKRGVENAVSAFMRKVGALNPMNLIVDNQDMPSLFDIVMNSMQILQYELGNFKAIRADILINPDLSDFTWIEYYRADELIQRGAESAERALPVIEKALTGKVAPYRPRKAAPAA